MSVPPPLEGGGDAPKERSEATKGVNKQRRSKGEHTLSCTCGGGGGGGSYFLGFTTEKEAYSDARLTKNTSIGTLSLGPG